MELRDQDGNITLPGVLIIVPGGMLAATGAFLALPYLIAGALPAIFLFCLIGAIIGFARRRTGKRPPYQGRELRP